MTNLVHDEMAVRSELKPVLEELQPSLRPHPDKLVKVCTVETLGCHCLGVTVSSYEVPVGEDSLVRRYIQALLSLVELLHYCALIGRELHSDEIFSQYCYASSLMP